MAVVVAHQVSPTSRKALAQGIQEAAYRSTDLVPCSTWSASMDADNPEAYRLGVADEMEKIVGEEPGVPWELRLAIAGADLGDALSGWSTASMPTCSSSAPDGAPPSGRRCLGSVAQTRHPPRQVPVLVVKAPWRDTSPLVTS